MSARARTQAGDVIEIRTPRGLAYAQATHEDRAWGWVLRILPGFYAERPRDLRSLVSTQHRYVTFFPLTQAVTRRIVEIIGREDVPGAARMFPMFRVAGLPDPKTGEIRDWSLWDGKRERDVARLTAEQRQLPILEVVNDTLLIERLVSDWTPEQEGLARAALPRTERVPPRMDVVHYLYFDTSEAGEAAAVGLRRDGLDAELGPASSSGSWLLRVAQVASTNDDVPRVRERLEAMAEELGARYDGWELKHGDAPSSSTW